MKVLALTHAHLHKRGLSPVSCERADSITGTWADRLNWMVDVVYTSGTLWAGIWPDGEGLKINKIRVAAPDELMAREPELFSAQVKSLLRRNKFAAILLLILGRLAKRIRGVLSEKGLIWPDYLVAGKKWGRILSATDRISKEKYDFIFVSVGYGDEYLLQTAITLSETLGSPMIVDFRDLWSDHQEPGRFTTKQRAIIRKMEKRLLKNTILISVPQTQMVSFLKRWVKSPVYLLSHSAYVDPNWPDGRVVSDEFVMVYAGKLYAAGPGIKMLLGVLKRLVQTELYKPFRCSFYVDDVASLTKMAAAYGVSEYISVNGWISPAELWGKIRSAHLLIITDLGVSKEHPMIPTKTFQYVYSGRRILGLFRYMEDEMSAFLEGHQAGKLFINEADAAEWVKNITFDKDQYIHLPALKDVPMREDIAAEFGNHIAVLLGKA